MRRGGGQEGHPVALQWKRLYMDYLEQAVVRDFHNIAKSRDLTRDSVHSLVQLLLFY